MTTRLFQPSRGVLIRNKFLGGRGVGLYLGQIGGTAQDLIYRNVRTFRRRRRGTVSNVPAVFVGDYSPATTELLNDATFAIRKTPDGILSDNFDVSLPAGYDVVGATYWLQLRPHEAGLETNTLYRPLQVTVGGTTILGTARLIRVVKLDATLAGASAQIDCLFFPALFGPQPTSFVLRQTGGPGTLPDVIVTASTGQRNVTFIVNGMATATDYTFEMLGLFNTAETLLIDTIPVTADADGPAALTVQFTEET